MTKAEEQKVIEQFVHDMKAAGYTLPPNVFVNRKKYEGPSLSIRLDEYGELQKKTGVKLRVDKETSANDFIVVYPDFR